MCYKVDALAQRYKLTDAPNLGQKVFAEARRRQGLDEPQTGAQDYKAYVEGGCTHMPPYAQAEYNLLEKERTCRSD